MQRLDLQSDASHASIAWLTICNLPRRNAMTRAMWRAMPAVLAGMPSGTRCLIVRGQGEHFCAGGDISEYPSFRFEADSLRAFHEDDVAPALDALLALDIPVIAMIQGHCMGGGVEIASCADLRMASVEASFGAPIAKLGMPMAMREMEIVLRAVGEATLREMLLEATVLDSTEMKARGFLQRVVPASELSAQALASAIRIAALSPQAARLNKQSLRAILMKNQVPALAGSGQYAMENIAAPTYAYAPSAEHREGIAAFLEKRPARF